MIAILSLLVSTIPSQTLKHHFEINGEIKSGLMINDSSVNSKSPAHDRVLQF